MGNQWLRIVFGQPEDEVTTHRHLASGFFDGAAFPSIRGRTDIFPDRPLSAVGSGGVGNVLPPARAGDRRVSGLPRVRLLRRLRLTLPPSLQRQGLSPSGLIVSPASTGVAGAPKPQALLRRGHAAARRFDRARCRDRGGRDGPDDPLPGHQGGTVHADEASAWDALHAGYAMRWINHRRAYSEDGPPRRSGGKLFLPASARGRESPGSGPVAALPAFRARPIRGVRTPSEEKSCGPFPPGRRRSS
jgi:hypothetical protein